MICGSGWSKSRLAKAAGAEPSGQMRDEQLHAVVRPEALFEVESLKNWGSWTTFRSWDVEKVHAVAAPSTCRSRNAKTTTCSRHFWMLKRSFCVASARDSAPCHKWAKRESLVAFPKTMAGVEHLKRIRKDAFRVAGAMQETFSSEMLGGQGADFLRGVAFWSIRSSGLRRWFCVTGATLPMTWHHFLVAAQYLWEMGWKNRKKHWHEGVSSALNFTFFRIASCLMLSSWKIEGVPHTSFVFDVVKFKNRGSLTEYLYLYLYIYIYTYKNIFR